MSENCWNKRYSYDLKGGPQKGGHGLPWSIGQTCDHRVTLGTPPAASQKRPCTATVADWPSVIVTTGHPGISDFCPFLPINIYQVSALGWALCEALTQVN